VHRFPVQLLPHKQQPISLPKVNKFEQKLAIVVKDLFLSFQAVPLKNK
jgi:hypothetical protein